MGRHEWGPVTAGPWMDAGQCIHCHMVVSAWNIARDKHNPYLPPCKGKK